MHEGADLGIEPLDPRDVVVDELDRRHLSTAYGFGLLQQGQIVQLRHAAEGYAEALAGSSSATNAGSSR